VKNSSFKQRIIRDEASLRFTMPALKSDFIVGRTSDHVERDAYEKGFAAGEKAGFEMGEQKAQVLLDRLESLINEVLALRHTIIKEVEPQCVELSVSIARKIMNRELTIKPDEIVKMAKEALMKIERTGQIVIKVNPALYDFFMKHKPDLVRIHPDVVIDSDPSVTRFGTVVVGPVEDVLTDLDEQLKNLIKDLGERHASD
jgi:flagellar assembly protein FliH